MVVLSFSTTASEAFQCYNAVGTSIGSLNNAASCTDLQNYVPTLQTPIKTIKMVFHVMQRESPYPKDNFDENNSAHVAYLNGIASRVNELYSSGNVMWCNCDYQATGYIRDARIRFELTEIKYWRSNEGYINQDGTYYNDYCINNFGVCKDEVLNVFFCQIPELVGGFGPTTHVMMFNQFKEFINGGGDTWGPGNLLGHEFGHTFGLGHSFSGLFPDMCQSEAQGSGQFCENREIDCTCSNNMMSYARLNDFISPMQMGEMHKTMLLSSEVSKYLKTTFDPNQETIITTPTTWDFARLITNNIRIKPGASLTIKCKTIMSASSQIIVERGAKLIVDGALITTKGPTRTFCNGQPNFERWEGIQVWGNTAVTATSDMIKENFALQTTDPGVVILKNGAVIENARVGIYGQQRGASWASQLEHFGGLISVNSSTFRNCRKAVEYIAHNPITVTSTFLNCAIEQRYLESLVSTNPVNDFEGVTSYQVSGMLFDEGCSFLNLERGIVIGNATATVLKSTFTLNKYAIQMGMVSPSADKKTFIGGTGSSGNVFRFCEWAVLAQSYGFLVVNNNIFEDCYNGVVLEGTSLFHIKENEFVNNNDGFALNFPSFLTGIALLQTGENGVNLVDCNEYKSNPSATTPPLIRDGIFAGGNNKGMYWTNNKFACRNDVRLSHLEGPTGGVISAELATQGAFGNPVFNIYSPLLSNHKVDILTPEQSLGLSNTFDYYVPTNDCTKRLIPRCPKSGVCSALPDCQGTPYNFVNQLSQSDIYPICSFGTINGLIAGGGCRTRECLNQYYQVINGLDNTIALTGDPIVKQERVNYNNRKMSLLHHLTDSLYNIGQVEDAAALWAADPDRVSREALVGLRIQTKNFTRAEQLLNNYPSTDPEDIRFKTIQQINLNRLTQSNFALSTNDLSALKSIANAYSAQSGYAKTLIWAMTGEMMPPVIPAEVAVEGRDEKTISAMVVAHLFSIQPNPAKDMLRIHLNDYLGLANRLMIRDINGKTILETSVQEDLTLDVSNFSPGHYAITLVVPTGKIQTILFVKSN